MNVNDQIAELNALRLRAPLRFLVYKAVTLVLFLALVAPFLTIAGALLGALAGALAGLVTAGFGFLAVMAVLTGASRRLAITDQSGSVAVRATPLPPARSPGQGDGE